MSININPTICIFGFGYTATFLAKKLAALGFNITGTSRKSHLCEHYKSDGYRIVDFTDASVADLLKYATHLFITIPPSDSTGDLVLNHFKSLLVHFNRQFQWVGYASSTGVYGDHQGAWVNESSSLKSVSSRGQRRIEAEQAWLKFSREYNLPLHIFRLAAIYGPQRNVFKKLTGTHAYSIYKEEQVFSRIHVADIVNIILASINSPNPYSIYNVADDEPSASHKVDQYAAKLLNIPPPKLIPFEAAKLSSSMQEFYSSHRRVSNAKIKAEFNLRLEYPSYREGLMELYKIEQAEIRPGG